MKKRTLFLIVGGGLVFACIACLAIGLITSSTPTYKATATAKAVAEATEAAKPTNTPKLADTSIPTAIPQPTETPKPSDTLQPTDTPAPPTSTPVPTDTPIPTLTFTPIPPVDLQGAGQTATQEFRLPASISVATFTHGGSRNFIVTVFQGDKEDLLINTIGPYKGERPLFGDEPVTLDIGADGAWTVHIEPISAAGSPGFSGRGDSVSGVFTPPKRGAWEITHNGERNFIVQLYCAGGTDLIQNEIGAVQSSKIIGFPDGPCFWEVQADGDWSLTPR
jgi:hypothetical protein